MVAPAAGNTPMMKPMMVPRMIGMADLRRSSRVG